MSYDADTEGAMGGDEKAKVYVVLEKYMENGKRVDTLQAVFGDREAAYKTCEERAPRGAVREDHDAHGNSTTWTIGDYQLNLLEEDVLNARMYLRRANYLLPGYRPELDPDWTTTALAPAQ